MRQVVRSLERPCDRHYKADGSLESHSECIGEMLKEDEKCELWALGTYFPASSLAISCAKSGFAGNSSRREASSARACFLS
jgi:hypothetical protein